MISNTFCLGKNLSYIICSFCMSYISAPFPAIRYFLLPISSAIALIESIGLPDAMITSVP